jgi:hypothetical protein
MIQLLRTGGGGRGVRNKLELKAHIENRTECVKQSNGIRNAFCTNTNIPLNNIRDWKNEKPDVNNVWTTLPYTNRDRLLVRASKMGGGGLI